MTKTLPQNKTGTNARYDFYRPHNRADTWYTGETLDPITGEILPAVSMTKQSFLEACDINNIVKQFSRTGMFNHVNAQAAQGQYLDLPDEIDFQEALHTVQRAEESFSSLPAKLRARFDNDPTNFVAFLSDGKNREEAIELGLITPPPPPPPQAPPKPPEENNAG